MNNEQLPFSFDDLVDYQVKACEINLAQLIRLYKWKNNGIVLNDQEDELLVGENSEVLNSLQRQKDKHKQAILSLDQRIRKVKERDKRNRELDAARHKKK